MNTKDEPGKGPAGAGGNRPHATLDLKATVVRPAGAEDEATSGSAVADGANAAPEAAPREEPEAAEADARKTQAAPVRAIGYGGFFTHLAAGVLGGIFALLAADMLASELGLGGPGESVDLAPLQQRIAALEAAGKQKPSTAELAAKLKSSEAKLGEIEALANTVDRLAQKQTELASGLAAVDAKIGTKGSDANNEARIAKLEQELADMSAAAERNPDSGRLPQLAAMSSKIAGLESMLTSKLDALRKSVNDEIETRMTVANEAGDVAKSGVQRLDRELSSVKSENAELVASLNTLKSGSDRANTDIKATAEGLSSLRTEVDARLATAAKASDVTAAVTPLAGKLSTLQEDVQGVIKGEESRKATAERIVLSLELADLKRAIDRGTGYAAELEHVRKLGDGSIDLTALDRFADKGVPTLAALRQDFKPVAFKMIDAGQEPADGSIMERLFAGAKSVVRVRKISHNPDDKSPEAVVARMETALNDDRLGDVLQEAKTLPQPAQDAAQEFLAKVEARYAVDRALQAVETQLKTSLLTPPGTAGAAQR